MASMKRKKSSAEICKTFLKGSWADLQEDIEVERHKNDLTDEIYFCSLPKNVHDHDGRKRVVICYRSRERAGQKALFKRNNEERIRLIYTRCAKEGLGPKLLHTFDGGRIEEYIPCERVSWKDIENEKLIPVIAPKIVKFHHLTGLWTPKNPTAIEEMLNTIKEYYDVDYYLYGEFERSFVHKIMQFNLEEELTWFSSIVNSINSPIVFSHNDLNPGNLVMRSDYEMFEEKLMILDYKVSDWNYRGYDLAYFLCLKKYLTVVKGNHLIITKERSNNGIHERKTLVREYLRHLKLSENHVMDEKVDNEEHLLKEIEFFTLLTYLTLIGWMRVNAVENTKTIPWDISFEILNFFRSEKENILKKYQHLL